MKRYPLIAGSSISLQVENAKDSPVRLYLEPWGECYEMPARTTYRIMAQGPKRGELLLEYAQDRITVWGWAGSVVTIFDGDRELGPGAKGRPAVPVADESTT